MNGFVLGLVDKTLANMVNLDKWAVNEETNRAMSNKSVYLILFS